MPDKVNVVAALRDQQFQLKRLLEMQLWVRAAPKESLEEIESQIHAGSGFVATLARPGGNLTGFINVEASIAGKWVGFLKEMAPGVKRAGLMFNPATAICFEYYLKPFEAAAQVAGLSVISLRVSNLLDIERAFAASLSHPESRKAAPL